MNFMNNLIVNTWFKTLKAKFIDKQCIIAWCSGVHDPRFL